MAKEIEMKNVTRRGDKYRIRVFLYTDANKKKHFHTETYAPKATKKKDIEDELSKRILEIKATYKSQGSDIALGREMFFRDFVEDWKENYASDPENMTISLRDSYYDLLVRKAVPCVGHLRMGEIKKAHIRKIMDSMRQDGLSLGTRKRVLSAVRSVFHYACEELDILESNPSRDYTLKKKKTDSDKTYNVFNESQYIAFLDAVRQGFDVRAKASQQLRAQKIIPIDAYQMHRDLNEQWIAFFGLAIYGGFRRGELLALTWEDINFDEMLITIKKTIIKKKNPDFSESSDDRKEIQDVKNSAKTEAGNRIVDVPDFVIQDLRSWKAAQKDLANKLGHHQWKGYTGEDFDQNYVFIDVKTGKMMDLGTPTHKMKSVISMYNDMHPDAPLPMIRLHDLRHTHATDLIYKGVAIEEIAQRLGHKNIYVTLTIYAHYLPKQKNDRKISKLYEKPKQIRTA